MRVQEIWKSDFSSPEIVALLTNSYVLRSPGNRHIQRITDLLPTDFLNDGVDPHAICTDVSYRRPTAAKLACHSLNTHLRFIVTAMQPTPTAAADAGVSRLRRRQVLARGNRQLHKGV